MFVRMLISVEFSPREEALNDHEGKIMGEWTLAMSMSVMRLGGQEGGHAWSLQHGHPLPKADFHHCQLFSLLPQRFMLRFHSGPILQETNWTLNGNLATVVVYPATLTKIRQTGWLIRSRGLFLAVLEVGGPRPKHRQIWGFDENPLPGSEMAVFSLGPHLAEGGKELSGALCSKSTDPIQTAPIPGSKHFPKGPLLLHHTGC